MKDLTQCIAARDELQQWLDEGNAPLTVCEEGKSASMLVRLQKNPSVDYLYRTSMNHDSGISWNNPLTFCGAYDTKNQVLYLTADAIVSLTKGQFPLVVNTEFSALKEILGKINQRVEDFIANDRNNLSTQEITSSFEARNLQYYQEYTAREEAIRLIFEGREPDGQFHSDYALQELPEAVFLAFLQDPDSFIQTAAEQHIKNQQERFLLQFLENDALLTEYQALVQDTGSPIHRMKAITDAVRASGAKTVTVTVQKDGVELAFKTAADALTGHRDYYNSYDIAARDRREFERLFGRYADYNAEDITKITYDLPPRLPLSQQKEFKRIKNLVIEEAVRLGRYTEIFDPTDGQEMTVGDTEPQSPDDRPLHDTESDQDMDTASVYAEQSAISGNPHAKYRAAKRILASPSAILEQTCDAVMWLTQAAEAGLDDAQYALGRLYLDGGVVERDTTLAVIWLSHAAEQGNPQAVYVLGKLNLEAGNHPAALRWFQRTAELGNPFAQYQLGKLLLTSGENQSDTESAVHWLTLAAGQGNPYAQFYIDHAESSPSLFTCATRLLHHMGNTFREQVQPPSGGVSFVDSKLRRKIREKKIAMGHKSDDHENPEIAPRQI